MASHSSSGSTGQSLDKGLSRRQVLRAITLNASYELHQDAETGSLEVGKLADVIELDRNLMEVPVEEIAGTRVIQTLVGGRVVYAADSASAGEVSRVAPPQR